MEQGGSLLLFLGRWHPLLVHLPIGILVVSFLIACFSRKQAYASLRPAIPFTLLIGAVSALFASTTGYLLSLNGGYETRTLGFHQWFGIGAAILSFLIWRLYIPGAEQDTRLRFLVKSRFGVFALLMVLLCVTGHYGGTLTHGSGYMTDAMPVGWRDALGIEPAKAERLLIENIQEAKAYEEVVQPILAARCQSCHGATKKEGGLALHEKNGLLDGGEGGPVMVANHLDESELYIRLTLPVGDEKRMPPKGRTPITPDEIAVVAWWIEQGALFDTQVKDMEQSAEIAAVLHNMEAGAEEESLPEAPPLPTASVEKLMAKGIKVMPIADGSNFVAISAINYPEFSDEDAANLVELKDNIVQLKLGRTAVTDQGLEHLAQLTVLRQLHLEHTAVTEEGLAALKACQHLQYLNLSGTQIGDAAIAHLKTLPALTNLYLFGANITPEAIVDFKQSKPSLAVDTGHTLPADAFSDPM